MNDGDALLTTIRDHPDDDVCRLVYADWLEETNEPARIARAEFIRLQCRYSQWHCEEGVPESWNLTPNATLSRIRKLLESHQPQWVQQDFPSFVLPSLQVFEPVFRRGFVHGLQLPELNHGHSRIVGRLPNVPDFPPELQFPWDAALGPNVFRQDCFTNIEWLTIARSPIGAALHFPIQSLVQRSRLPELTRLGLPGNVLGANDLRTLTTAEWFPNLTHLDLSWCGIGNEGFIAFATLAGTNLERLVLDTNQISISGIREFVQSPMRTTLQHLDLTNNPLGTAGNYRLIEFPFPHLRSLNMRRTLLGDQGVAELTASPSFPELRWLDLSSNHLTDVSIIYLIRTRTARNLRGLCLEYNRISDEGIIELAQSPAVSELVALRLDSAKLTKEAVAALCGSPYLEKLIFLSLHSNLREPISDEFRSELTERFGIALSWC